VRADDFECMRTEPELVLDGVNEEEAACGVYNLRYPEKTIERETPMIQADTCWVRLA
jgi:hypothetical protein